MIFLTAGHHKRDAGATFKGRREADETIRIRNAIANKLLEKKIKIWTDNDEWDLSRTITVISKLSKPQDIICDLHFNAGSATATGCEVFVADNASAEEENLAKALVNTLASTLAISNRGVKRERESQHRRLGIMRPAGRNVLIEVCFISNAHDMQQYDIFFDKLVDEIVKVLAGSV
jgi:N-acetylmuramoyl-L-alanine amidase